MKLFLKGDRCYGDKCAYERRAYPPGQHGQRRTKLSDYGLQLREKQKAKRIYGLNERQFRNIFDEAASKQGDTGEMLVRLLELRLDNAVYRAGFAKTRAAARQFVSHAHFDVNGKKVNIPSYRVRSGEMISIRQNKRGKGNWKGMEETLSKHQGPSWLSLNKGDLAVKVTGAPMGEELKQSFDVKLIVEFYSRQ
mgnify:CR=1 FL=1